MPDEVKSGTELNCTTSLSSSSDASAFQVKMQTGGQSCDSSSLNEYHC